MDRDKNRMRFRHTLKHAEFPAGAMTYNKGQEENTVEEAIKNMYDLSTGDGWDIEIKGKCVIWGETYVTLSIIDPEGKDHGALMPIFSVADQLRKGVKTSEGYYKRFNK